MSGADFDDGGPAFPVYDHHGNGQQFLAQSGMTLRDYFAAKALPGVYREAMQGAREGSDLLQYVDWRTGVALDAYLMADAMLAAREGKQ